MATTVNNRNGGDGTGVAVLGIVAVVAISGILAVVIAAITFVLLGSLAVATGILGYKLYQLRVYRTVSLAAIQAGMAPQPMERRIPPVRELALGRGRDREIHGNDAR
jgi:hypothetical protein